VKPRYLIFSTKAIALYIISRAFFFSLTHIGPYPLHYAPSVYNHGYSLYHLVTFSGNFFYSGHTAFPFLLALIFWDNKYLRYLFLILTVFFGASVLLAHVHYSIDVFAAPFIVYGMYVITAKLFPRDYALFTS
jgi:membrane-associated phospholipid phosphatase